MRDLFCIRQRDHSVCVGMSDNERTSAVEFPTPTRIHVAIAVRDVTGALPFYEALFGQAPSKVRSDYAKFEIFDPPVNFSLNAADSGGHGPGPQHFGIQVKHSDALATWKSRIEAAGFATTVEDAVTCCYAVQDKFWASDPEGHRWEIFMVTTADTAVHSLPKCCPTATTDANADAPTKAAPRCCPLPDSQA